MEHHDTFCRTLSDLRIRAEINCTPPADRPEGVQAVRALLGYFCDVAHMAHRSRHARAQTALGALAAFARPAVYALRLRRAEHVARAQIAMLAWAAADAGASDPLASGLHTYAAAHGVGDVLSEDPDSNTWWVFNFGAYGDTTVWVRERHLESALEIAAEVLPPGMFCEPDYEQAREELATELGCDRDDVPEDRVYEHAEEDLTYTESGYLTSYEWGVVELDGSDDAVRSVVARSLRRQGF